LHGAGAALEPRDVLAASAGWVAARDVTPARSEPTSGSTSSRRETMEGRMLIGGKLVEAAGGGWIDAVNPATEEVIGRFPEGTADDVGRAVDAAEDAWRGWFASGINARHAAVNELAAALEGATDELSELEVRDSGNTLSKVRDDVRKAARGLRHFAEIAYEAQGRTIPGDGTHLHATLREPFGTVARIVPFNHPIMFAASRVGAPLLAGNAVVVKAPEQASLSVCRFAELCSEIFPPGVVNVVTGNGLPVGDALVRDRRVRRVAFTGSVPTGQAIMRAAGDSSIKQLSLELGGKNPLVVLPDAGLDAVASAAVSGMNFAWQGQSCGSTSRVLVHEDAYDTLVDDIAERVSAIELGDPMSLDTQMGPLVTADHHERVLGFVDRAQNEGARLVAGGARPSGSGFERGYWMRPTVFADVAPGSDLFRNEVFGPILAVTPYDDLDHAVELANDVAYGLTASIWTNDLKRAMSLVTQIRAGYVWVNEVSRRYKGTPFGGFDDSGVGREEGLEELLSYSAPKTVHINFG
jgi:acyl-CoA reductase-like NAD-dependent aldehyde dehydrogenase